MKLALALLFYFMISPVMFYYLFFGGRVERYFKKKREQLANFLSKIFNLNSLFSRLLKSLFYLFEVLLVVLTVQTLYLANYTVPTNSMSPTIMVNDKYLADVFTYNFKGPERCEVIVFRDPISGKRFCKRLVGMPGEKIKLDDKGLHINGEPHEAIKGYFGDVLGRSSLIGQDEWKIPQKGDKIELDYIEFSTCRLVNGKMEKVYVDLWELREIIEKSENKKIKFIDLGSMVSEKDGEEGILNALKKVDTKAKNGIFYYYKIERVRTNIDGELSGIIMDEDVISNLILNGSATLDENYYFCLGDNSINSDDSRYRGFVRESSIKGRLIFRWWPLNRFGIFEGSLIDILKDYFQKLKSLLNIK